MSMKPAVNEAAVIAFRDAAEFEAWLDAHVDLRVGVWLKIAKQGSGVPSLTDDEAVDLGLCYGWISGQRKSYDEVYYLQKYVPRRPRSRWSQVNVAKVEELIAAGRMRPSGLAQVEADLGRVHVKGGDEIHVGHVIAAESHVHETGNLLVRISVAVVLDALNERAGAVPDAGDGDANGTAHAVAPSCGASDAEARRSATISSLSHSRSRSVDFRRCSSSDRA